MQNRNAYYAKLQCILRLTTGKLWIVLHKITIVLHYTTPHYIPFLTPTIWQFLKFLWKIYDMPNKNCLGRVLPSKVEPLAQWRSQGGAHWGTFPTNSALCPTKILIFSRSLKIAIATSYHII